MMNCSIVNYSSTLAIFECPDVSVLCNPLISVSGRRKLFGNDDAIGDDYQFEAKSPSAVHSEYSVVMTLAGDRIKNVLGNHINGNSFLQSTGAVACIFSIIAVLIFGIFYFNIWDRLDYNHDKYVRSGYLTSKIKKSSNMKQVSDALKNTLHITVGTNLRKSSKLLMVQSHKKTMLADAVESDETSDEEFEDGSNALHAIKSLRLLQSTASAKKSLFNFSDTESNSLSAWFSNTTRRLLQAIFRNHVWIRVVSYSSLRLPRRYRFLSLAAEMLIFVVFNSLFFGLSFPSGSKSVWTA